ncbi:MAG: YkgJ family cysteine cluster protein [Chitinophagales bacterium]|nr:YkgJ family cysteine cluster protein [Chitinophagales bacterium]
MRIDLKLKQLSAKQVDELFHRAHQDVFSRMDCLTCANCCKTTSPLFTQEDIGRLAQHLDVSRSAFLQQYLEMDEDGDFVFNRPAPCPFLLSDNKCSVYESRPNACRTYPHTNQRKVKSILNLTLKNAEICPAVQQMLTRIEEAL